MWTQRRESGARHLRLPKNPPPSNKTPTPRHDGKKTRTYLSHLGKREVYVRPPGCVPTSTITTIIHQFRCSTTKPIPATKKQADNLLQWRLNHGRDSLSMQFTMLQEQHAVCQHVVLCWFGKKIIIILLSLFTSIYIVQMKANEIREKLMNKFKVLDMLLCKRKALYSIKLPVLFK